MSEVKPARGDAVFQGFMSPGLQSTRERVLFGIAVLLIIAFVILSISGGVRYENTKAYTESRQQAPVVVSTTLSQQPANNPAATLPEEPPEEEAISWLNESVTGGDTLSRIFKRAGFNELDVHNVINQSEHGKSLTQIFPGQTIEFQVDQSGGLLGIRHIKSPLEFVSYELTDAGFESEVKQRSPDAKETWTSGVITSSLFVAGEEAGLSQGMIMNMAHIFGGVVDFALDPRRGDTMRLVYEELFLDGEKVEDGDIIAASFTNQGETFDAYRYTDANGDTNYYNEDGVSMKKTFLMAPLDFTRISSNFNPSRLHPVYKTTRPHRGTDYAAPTGTPVYAAGDGRVVKAGYSRANGNYVFIQHGERYVTRYLHLHKRAVNNGQRVSQNQLIGTVGSTGTATGPHLHYEFLVNGVHRNPRTIYKELPKAKQLPQSEMESFRQSIALISDRMAALRASSSLVMNDSANAESTPN